MIPTGRKTSGMVAIAPGGKVGITADGGIAYSMLNKSGATTVKGYIVHPSSSTDGAFNNCEIDEPDIIGVVFGDDDGAQVNDGVNCWIVKQGLAYIYSITAATREWFIRNREGAEGGSAGQAIAEALPSVPFATNKHFQECGHCLESTGGAGLVLCSIHFN